MTALAASNPRIKRLRRLSGRRSARVDDGCVVLEGPVVIGEALQRGISLSELYAEPDAPADIVDAARAAGVVVHEVGAGVLAGVTDTVTSRPVVAVAARPVHALADVVALAVERRRPLLVLVEVRDPGNVGTIVRTAEAAGAVGVVCSAGTADPTSPKAVRASSGTVLDLPVVDGGDPAELVAAVAAAGIVVAATVVRGGHDPAGAPLAGAVALVLGGEAQGLAPAITDGADLRLTIPMEGRAESLNVAVAAGVLCFEALRQRRAERGTDWTPPAADDTVDRP
ncbi:MAG TPA: RNA methyltransferase [Acidimicrobiales bacterium]|nr:RNA methyltransferase [Acidimicrobiales bacterium]